MKLHWLFIGFLILSLSGVYGQDIYEINPDYPVHNLNGVLKVYSDEAKNLSTENFLGELPSGYMIGDSLPRFLEVGVRYWGVLDLKPLAALEDWNLHFEDKMIGPPAWTKSNGKVDVYAFNGGELIFHQKTGIGYSKSERGSPEHWATNQISLSELPFGKDIRLIIRAEGNAMGYPAYFNLSARSAEQPHYHELFQFNRSFNIFMFGMTFMIFLYHLLQFLYLRDKVYLWFCTWLLVCMLTQAMTVGLFLDHLGDYFYTKWLPISNSQFFLYWLFGRIFMDSRRKFPLLDKAILGLCILIIIEIFATGIYVAFFKGQTYFTGVGYHYIFLCSFSAIGFVLSILLLFQKDRFAHYFAIGSLIGSACLVIGTLWSMAVIRMPVKLDPYSTGIFLQIVIYSFGIAYRRQYLSQQIQEERVEAAQSKAEIQRIKDLDELKSRFFTNISHELRTPLTLIQGPVKQMIVARKDLAEGSDSDFRMLNIVSRNTERLQVLVDELLELSRIESGKTAIVLKQGDINAFIKSVVYAFESLAERSNIRLEARFEGEYTSAFYDGDKLQKIIYNLMSNAFKYTSEGGLVSIYSRIDKSGLQFEVQDTGKGMTAEELELIFDRFYRVEGSEEKGSGIGLALCKELIDLMQGKIEVSSTPGKGTRFKLILPVRKEDFPESQILLEENPAQMIKPASELEPAKEVTSLMPWYNKDKPLLLLIEDNEDLRVYVQGILQENFRTVLAEDGLQGERMAIEHIPDVILSDVMMPGKDGFELCHALKTNNKTSHIPIILLTAKAGQQNKVEGLRIGADAYLTKPFDAEELIIRLNNFIEQKQRLWEQFKTTGLVLTEAQSLSSLDDQFLKKVVDHIRNNLDEETLSVENLAKNIGFSRGQLHRKLTALINTTPTQLISDIRLGHAYQLLKNRSVSISEAAYAVGFTNMSYFSKKFREKYGLSPSQFLENPDQLSVPAPLFKQD